MEFEKRENLFYKQQAHQKDVQLNQLKKEKKESEENFSKLERERDVLHSQSVRDKNRYVSFGPHLIRELSYIDSSQYVPVIVKV